MGFSRSFGGCMADYFAVCEAAASAPVDTGAPATDCTTAGGTYSYIEVTAWGLPELTLEDGGRIAVAIIALLVVGFAIRACRKALET